MKPTRLQPTRFLLVEDDEDHALLIQRAFQDGTPTLTRVNRVKDGEEAMAFIHQSGKYTGEDRPDVIVLDLKLPRKSGHEVLQEIKADAKYRHIPIVILTTSKAVSDVERAYDSHANSYLVKPLEFGQFDELVHELKQYWCSWNESLAEVAKTSPVVLGKGGGGGATLGGRTPNFAALSA